MHSWIVDHLKTHFDTIQAHLDNDESLRLSALAAAKASGNADVSFGLVSSDATAHSLPCIIIKITASDAGGKMKSTISAGAQKDALFSLSARSEDWQTCLVSNEKLVRPYQSYWGMLRVLGPEHKEVCVLGDLTAFARYARVWRIALDRIRDAVTEIPLAQSGAQITLPEEENISEDHIIGRYTWINHSEYGAVKIFYETSGPSNPSPQIPTLLFLHTAGSDSRQYHTLMNNPTLLTRCKMVAFDLPAHGRSSLGTTQHPDSYSLTEQSYLESINLVATHLKLANVIICGASMAGHVCLAAAIAATNKEFTFPLIGAIPCEATAHLPLTQPIYEISGLDAAILDPERVCGMIAPSSPEYYKRQIWWQYSTQGTGVFAGDLKFYFRGWDGRGRVEKIDTSCVPVYMLTGVFDYSCSVVASRETAEMIKGGGEGNVVFEEMDGLGHFPLTENPGFVLPSLVRALEYIVGKHRDGKGEKAGEGGGGVQVGT